MGSPGVVGARERLMLEEMSEALELAAGIDPEPAEEFEAVSACDG